MPILTAEEMQSIVDRSKKTGADDYAVLRFLQHIAIVQDQQDELLNEIAERLDDIELKGSDTAA